MELLVEGDRALRFDDGTPVTAASALAPLGDGWLVAQDDATSAAWVRPRGVERLRLFPPVDGHDVFSEAAGTKHLKPDLEAACALPLDGRPGVLLLGSGSSPLRRRGVLVRAGDPPTVEVGDLGPLYDAVARALGVPDDRLDIEGVARNGPVLRWFHRGVGGRAGGGTPSGSVDVGLPALVAALRGQGDPAAVPLRSARTYDLGSVDGVQLAATDAVAVPGGAVLLSAAAEDAPTPVDDGPVVAAALVLLDGDEVAETVVLPELRGVVQKVEGLAVDALLDDGVRLRAVVDADDAQAPSVELVLRVTW